LLRLLLPLNDQV